MWRQTDVAPAYFLAHYRGTSPGSESFPGQVSLLAHLRRLPPLATLPKTLSQHSLVELAHCSPNPLRSDLLPRSTTTLLPPSTYLLPPRLAIASSPAVEVDGGCGSHSNSVTREAPSTERPRLPGATLSPYRRELIPSLPTSTSLERYSLSLHSERNFCFFNFPSANCH